MKKVTMALSIVFTILTFIGAGYVIYNNGKVNAGYTVIPMLFAIISISCYRHKK